MPPKTINGFKIDVFATDVSAITEASGAAEAHGAFRKVCNTHFPKAKWSINKIRTVMQLSSMTKAYLKAFSQVTNDPEWNKADKSGLIQHALSLVEELREQSEDEGERFRVQLHHARSQTMYTLMYNRY